MDRRRLAAAVMALGIALLVVAGPALTADRSVTIAGFAYAPASVTVGVGDSVTWTNDDSAAHTATSVRGWNTGDISPGDSATVTFRTAGTFDYQCGIHPAMTGRVVVRSAGGGTTPPTDMASDPAHDDDGWLAAALAVLGVVMVVGTFVADRRFRPGRSES